MVGPTISKHLQKNELSIRIFNRTFQPQSVTITVDRSDTSLVEENIPAELLEIEITESALINHTQRALHSLNGLSAPCLSIAVDDDFGTGFSSLGYLKSLPANTLEIDQNFVREMLTDESSEYQNLIRQKNLTREFALAYLLI